MANGARLVANAKDESAWLEALDAATLAWADASDTFAEALAAAPDAAAPDACGV